MNHPCSYKDGKTMVIFFNLVVFLIFICFIVFNIFVEYRDLGLFRKPNKKGHKWKRLSTSKYKRYKWYGCSECDTIVCWNYSLNKYTKGKIYNKEVVISINVEYGMCTEEKMHAALS